MQARGRRRKHKSGASSIGGGKRGEHHRGPAGDVVNETSPSFCHGRRVENETSPGFRGGRNDAAPQLAVRTFSVPGSKRWAFSNLTTTLTR